MITAISPRIVRRETIDAPVSIGIDGRHGNRRDSNAHARCSSVKEHAVGWAKRSVPTKGRGG